jgi:hypothetical protein
MLEELMQRLVARAGEEAVRVLLEAILDRNYDKAAYNARLLSLSAAAEEAVHAARKAP